MRINARLDDEQARKLDYVRAVTGSTVSDVIKEALERYYAELAARPVRAAEVLRRTGLVGCAEADANLSTDYKRSLGDSLAAKHGHR